MYNIVAAIFEVESEGYQALTTIAKTPIIDGGTTILQMALVKRENGGLRILDSFDSGLHTTNDTLTGGLIGSMVGILGGPIGVLLMGSYGALAGSMIDSSDAIGTASIMEKVAEKLQDSETALIALVDEEQEYVLDDRLGNFRTTIARFDAAVVAQEVDEAQKMQKEMERQARQELRATKKEDRKEKLETKKAELKEQFEEFRVKFKKDKE